MVCNMAMTIDPRSGFCKSNATFYSKRLPLSLPSNPSLDIATFISSHPHHGKTAFIDAATGHRLSFKEVWSAFESISCLLSDMGIRKGHVVFILSPNSVFFPVVCLSVMSLGAVVTTANPLNTRAEILKQVADSRPALAFTVPELIDKIAPAHLPIILIDENVIKKEPSCRQVKDRVTQDDTATLLYSSGTTGVSKGVVSSHRSLIAMVQTVLRQFRLERGNANTTFICTVPMFHIYGLLLGTGLLASGSTVVVLPKFSFENMLAAVEMYSVTHLPVVPPILVALVDKADEILAKYSLNSLQLAMCGGAPLSKQVIEGFMRKFPAVEILQGYGLTETCGIGSWTASSEESRRYGAVGLLSPCMEAKVVDPVTGEMLPVQRTGELWLKGPTIMKGYFNNAEATAATISSDGWLRTGDLCCIDEEGFVFVVDRLKELIKYKGYQVAPAELEALLLGHPEIADAAVIPFPDKEVGQYPMAYVVRKAGTGGLIESMVMDFVSRQVAPYKKIRRVVFIDSIPRNPSGKILRKDLIKLATSKL